MAVPFEQLGPGQKGRWVYQVLGSNGPVPNPNRIRYLAAPPQEQSIQAQVANGGPLAPISALTGYAQLVGTAASIVNLGVSAAILVEVRKQSRMLRELQSDMREVKASLDSLLEIAHRTDLNVAEGHLREGLRHALDRSVQHDEVDLVLLAELIGAALTKFERSLQSPWSPGANRDILLAADVRERAEAALNVLWAARRTAVEAHNTNCGGDAGLVYRDDSTARRLRELAETAALLESGKSRAKEMGEEVRKHLHQSWKLYGDTGWYRKLVKNGLSGKLESDLALLRQVPDARLLLNEVGDDESLREARQAGVGSFADALEGYLQAWCAHSDAGLLWRLAEEVRLQQDGHFWRLLTPWGDLSEAGERSLSRAMDLRLPVSAT